MEYKFRKIESLYKIGDYFSCSYNYEKKALWTRSHYVFKNGDVNKKFKEYFKTKKDDITFNSKKELIYNLNQFNDYYSLNLDLEFKHYYTTWLELNHKTVIFYYPNSKEWSANNNIYFKTRKAVMDDYLKSLS